MAKRILSEGRLIVKEASFVRLHGRLTCLLTHDGRTQSLSEWAKEVGISRAILYCRLFCDGWTVAKALSVLAKKVNRHGQADTAEYAIWNMMIQRCTNPRMGCYGNYGKRGITVCDRWRQSFSAFYADMGSRPSSQHTIERIDNDGAYKPGNCRWATRAEQARNNRRNVVIQFDGQSKILSDWATVKGLSVTVLWKRLFKLGWSVEKALTTPLRRQR